MPDDVDDSSDDVVQPPGRVRRQRVSRWDRPKPPHDWRWVLGLIGRTLVTIGLLMFAFVAYQLWGTGIQTAREQDRLGDKFDELLETTVPLTSLPPTTLPPTTEPITSDPSTSQATTTTVDPITTVPPPAITAPPEGEPVARLDIPDMGLDGWEIVEGVNPEDLADGPGHFPETPLPGQLGNSALAGHRTTHGQPFRNIDKLEIGDDIFVTTLAGQYIYVVTGTTIVAPSDYGSVIPTLDFTKATLTLTSCHPPTSTKSRYVVFASLDLERSSPVTQAPTDLGDASASTLPGEDEVPDETLESTTVPVPVSSDPATTDSVAPSTTVAAEVPADAVEPPPTASAEAFENEWFSDTAAFPHVAIWGLILVGIALGAYAVARRARRLWVGALVGFVPFVVVLYFFFENVSRLLPPNL